MRYTVALALILAGCATAKVTYGPDGRQVHSINCSGNLMTWNACYEKAGALCGARGYDIVERTGDQNSTFAAGGGWASGGAFNSRTLLVSCK